MDAVVAQGYEAGGHRGLFDPDAPDGRLGTLALTRLLVRRLHVPVIAAGRIMDGAGIAAVLRLGALAAQIGTAFVACPEAATSAAHRLALLWGDAAQTVMTTSISGRPARCLANRFTALSATLSVVTPPEYPIAYDAGKALHAAAVKHDEHGYGAHWAGQGAPLARALQASDPFRPAGMTGERGMFGPGELQPPADLGQRSGSNHRTEAGDDIGESLRIDTATGC